MTCYPTETQTISLTMEVADAISAAVNARAVAETGVELPPLVWVWHQGVYSLPCAEQQEVEFRGRVAPRDQPESTERHLREWAAALRLTESTTSVERTHGRRTYTGVLAGSRIRITGRVEATRSAA
ncbi:hypothetical protein IU501_30995 [Nocardia otitidiscaviarum]|uniref:Uncharacterized protein n=1 Tax=Nocardia otitidiscaviarum TaxID=1823 RepID=A0A516NLJ7_9NOCA|nr:MULTISPECIES: hypothetical protein [Nocardia]MBF6137405.1 hypothetical protein [Nocardia otitidiscaviarum]MBF6241121.1 hypothetical protein [Nocardia otitidiscaviarum]MBF6488333.1 hypothetical protein [Nocardia otitidiscaviarum]MCP9624735.1 DUF4131 domain-containing protein [Nocardia otitidiscaviarum]QDP79790.1 hypothetical protein FOH10_14765 [Nocardia otitidiscaviarum]